MALLRGLTGLERHASRFKFTRQGGVEAPTLWYKLAMQILWNVEKEWTGLSFAKAREAPSNMRCQVALMLERRWTRMLAVTCATAFAASLVEPEARPTVSNGW